VRVADTSHPGGGSTSAGRLPTDSPTSVFRPDLLAGQVAIVTGGGSGIGLGISELLAALGAHVVLASRKRDTLDAAAAGLRAAGGAASVAPVDVRDPQAVQQMVHQVAEERGRIDILVNNAAGNFYAPSATLSANAWRAVLEIDLYGTFFMSQSVAPTMRAQGRGRIINISMTLHYRGWPQMAHATAAKAGIDALTRTLAVEWAPWGIRVNAVAPGPIPTEGVRKAFALTRRPPAPSQSSGEVTGVHSEPAPETGPTAVFALESAMEDYAKRAIPAGRWGTPRDIANMVAYLGSPAGDWITGAIFVVDGGEWLHRQAMA
jgi:2,4-dienoyl-CoA reductase [(3E)-enoyl-CoA-producing], peroxisomal